MCRVGVFPVTYSLAELTRPGAKCPLRLPPDTIDRLSRCCCFTDEEAAILRYRARGLTLLEISFAMQRDFGRRYPDGQYSDRKVDRRIRSIKDKIARVML